MAKKKDRQIQQKPSKATKQLENSTRECLTGRLRLHPKGFGFVIPDQPDLSEGDVFIPKHLTDTAVDGDRVEVEINQAGRSEKGPEGKILAILERARTHLAGIVRLVASNGTVFVHAPVLGSGKEVVVEASPTKLKEGDRVVLEIIDWGGQSAPILCTFSRKIGHITDPAADVAAAVEEFGLQSGFSKAALKEAKRFGKRVTNKDLEGRKNLTEIDSFTIDPTTAKDFDDALSIRKTASGHFQLGVHIADVAHYIRPGTALDHEAYERANSTYFPGTCLPMLPEELSNNLCSLRAGVIRLTSTVLMEFDGEGRLCKHKIVRGYIKSCKRFTYEEAKEILDGKKKSPYAPRLHLMVELCQLLKRKRYERGSIDFSLPDLVIEVDKKGEPKGVKWVEYDITHQLVEEFMLKANEIVAKELTDRGKAPLFRTHEEPSKENFEEFCALARTLGFSLPALPTSQDLQRLFEKAKKTQHLKQLSIGFIRSMKLAYYSQENVGHFGLALDHYTHFTSPIRRYCDLMIHRLLFNEESEEPALDRVALHCSERERISFRAEMNVKQLKKLRLLKRYYEEDPGRVYEAVITKVKPFGLYFEVSALMLEGFLHVSELEDDYFVHNQRRNLLHGKDTGKVHENGGAIAVRVISIDLILLEAKWEIDCPLQKGRR